MPKPADPIPARIFTIRGLRVILDTDLARLYGVRTKIFNQAIKRNRTRFPDDFAFQLTREESLNWSQLVTSSAQTPDLSHDDTNSSQFVMSSKTKHRGATYRPWAFSEHGALMAANILRSERAAEMSVYVVRAFVKQREILTTNAVILKRLAEIDKTLLEHDSGLRLLWHRLQPLLAPLPEPPKRKIGFHSGNR